MEEILLIQFLASLAVSKGKRVSITDRATSSGIPDSFYW